MTSHIYKNLKKFRISKGWSQGEFANRLKISIPAYSKIETGVTDPNVSRLYQMAKVLGINVIELISVTGEYPIIVSDVEFEQCKTKLLEAQKRVLNLQHKVIMLYEEVRELTKGQDITIDSQSR